LDDTVPTKMRMGLGGALHRPLIILHDSHLLRLECDLPQKIGQLLNRE